MRDEDVHDDDDDTAGGDAEYDDEDVEYEEVEAEYDDEDPYGDAGYDDEDVEYEEVEAEYEEVDDEEYDGEDVEYDDAEYEDAEYDDGAYVDEPYDDEEGGSRARQIVVGAVAVLLIALGAIVVNAVRGGDSGGAPAAGASSTTAVDEAAAAAAQSSTTPATTVAPTSTAAATTAPTTTMAPTTAAATSTVPADDGAAVATDSTVAGADTEESGAGAATTSTTAVEAEQAPTTVASSGAAGESVTYDTLPDGSPAPVVAVYGEDSITLTGAVPSEAAKERLEGLAVANAKPGQADSVDNLLTVNPDVPIGVGVRVIELTSERFPERNARIRPAHAQELDRVANVLRALPKVTVLVIGHSDQIGDEAENFALSERRAAAVTSYLAAQGIDPNRLASRAVGEEDLLTFNDDAVSLALNRRTEFVFYGLLVD